MSTINISLPQEQVRLIDRLVEHHGFANRSEFIRSIVRLITHRPEIVDTAATFPFVAPQSRSVNSIVADFSKTKKYSKSFLRDLKEGLASSDYFLTQ